MKSIVFLLQAVSDGFEVSISESFQNILTTPKNTVVMLPTFGTDFHELIDRAINEEWLIDFRRIASDAMAWEKRKVLSSLEIIKSDAINGSINIRFNFKDKSFFQGVFNGF